MKKHAIRAKFGPTSLLRAIFTDAGTALKVIKIVDGHLA